jgi:hypothetical protein
VQTTKKAVLWSYSEQQVYPANKKDPNKRTLRKRWNNPTITAFLIFLMLFALRTRTINAGSAYAYGFGGQACELYTLYSFLALFRLCEVE